MERSLFDSISPADYRYWDKDVAQYLSENGFTRYKLLVELALVKVLQRRGICSLKVVKEIESACSQVTTEEVYTEEKRVGHDIRVLVNCIQKRVSNEAKPYVHMTATSYDIVDTANAIRYKDVTEKVILPTLISLEEVLIAITLKEAEIVQVGRTHGQHAVPITFGFAMAEYVSRLGKCILSLKQRANELVGKFSGAVGAYNASSLFFDDPEVFETEVLAELGLKPADYSTQIVPPERMARLFSELTLIGGVLANLARDMRNLQRTEIGEVGEEFTPEQVGSSTMPQKRNPKNFENVESLWKVLIGHLTTVYLDQISEHQRDLTNSASTRTYGEAVCYLVSMAKRLTQTMKKLRVDYNNLQRNLTSQQGQIVAEPLYIILAALGHPNAHEKVLQLTLKAQSEQKPLKNIVLADPDLQLYLKKVTLRQWRIFANPSLYTGIAAKKAKQVAITWMEKLGIPEEEI